MTERASPLRDALKAATRLSALAWIAANSPETVPAPFAPFHHDLCRLPPPGTKQARVVFRGAAKSTLTRVLILWACATGQTSGVLWLRANIADVLSDRDAMRVLAELCGLPYSVDAQRQMMFVNGVPIWTKTPKGRVRGLQHTHSDGRTVRPGLVVWDDVETDESARPPRQGSQSTTRGKARASTQTENLETWLTSAVIPTAGHAVEPTQRVIMLGTPLSQTSLIARAMRREPPFDTWLEPLVVPIVKQVYNDDGVPVESVPAWPDTYNPGLEAETDDQTWATEYMLNPLPPGSLVFPPERTRYVSPQGGFDVFVGVDPAAGGADFTGCVATALTPAGLLYVDAEQIDADIEDVPERVGAFIRRQQANGHRVILVGVEAIGAWKVVANAIAANVPDVRVITEQPVLSKLERAVPLSRWHKRRAVFCAAHLRGSPLMIEHDTWDRGGRTVTGHDDMVDAAVWSAGLATQGWRIEPPEPDG